MFSDRHLIGFARTSVMMMIAMATAFAATAPDFSTLTFDKKDPAVTLTQLHGKTVIVLFFQSWCPVCNGWSPDLIKQMEKAYGNDRNVVLMAIKTDGDVVSGKSYLAERGNPKLWIVAGDDGAAYAISVMGKEELWQAAVIDPDGNVVRREKASMHFGSGQGRSFALARPDVAEPYRGKATMLFPAELKFPVSLAQPVRLAEIGCFAEACALAAAGSKEDADLFRKSLLEALGKSVPEWIATLAKADDPTRLLAYMHLRSVAALKGTEPAKEAVKSLAEAARDKTFKPELDAERSWLELQEKARKLSAAQRQAAMGDAMKKFAAAFPNTWYGRMAGGAR